jgi:hypothetical protein
MGKKIRMINFNCTYILLFNKTLSFSMINYEDITSRIATNKDAALIADLSRETFYNAFAPSIQKKIWISL